METYVLMIQLVTAGPVVALPVNDCLEGVRWIRAAREWAERSGIDPVLNPMYVCFPADAPQLRFVRQ